MGVGKLRLRLGLLGLWMFLFVCAMVFPIYAQDGLPDSDVDEVDRVEDYIRSIGLSSRVTEYLEFELASELNSTKRRELASKLAEAYAVELFQTPTADLCERARNLLAVYTDIQEPRLEIALSQFDFQEEVTRFNKAWEQGKLFSTYQSNGLRNLVDEFRSSITRLESRVSEFRIQLEIDPGNVRLNRKLKIHAAAELQARYLLAWSLYHLAVADLANRRQHVNESDASFRGFFEIAPDKKITEISDSWFAVATRRNRAAIAGWASVSRIANQLPESAFLFRQAKKSDAGFDVVPIEMKAQAYAFDYASLHRILKQRLPSESQSQQAKQLASLAIRLCARSNLRQSDLQDERGRELERERTDVLDHAVTHLLLNQSLGQLRQLDSSGCLEEVGDPLIKNWCQAFLAFARSEQDAQTEELTNASRAIRGALAAKSSANNGSNEPGIGEGASERQKLGYVYLLAGKIEIRLRNYEAADKYLGEVTRYASSHPELVAESLWWQAQVARLSKQGERGRQLAIDRLSRLVEQHPNSGWASQANFELTKIRAEELPPGEALRRLNLISPDSPFFPAAQLEKLKCLYRSAQENVAGDSAEPQVAEEFLSFAKELTENTEFDAKLRLEAAKLRLDYLLRDSAAAEVANLKNALATAEKLTSAIPTPAKQTQVLLYYRFQVQRAIGNKDAAYQLARRLGEDAARQQHQRSAWLFQLQYLRDDPNRGSVDFRQRRLEILQQLSRSYGDSDGDLRSTQNARIAFSQLARAELEVGDWRSAAKKFEQLNQLFPGQTVYLIGLADTKMKAERYDEAIPIWRRIIAGSKTASENWLTAKAGLIRSLGMSEQEKAMQVLLQTRQLAPTMPDSWKKRFEILERELKQ